MLFDKDKISKVSPVFLLCGVFLLVCGIYSVGIADFAILDDLTNLTVLKQLDKNPEQWANIVLTNESGILGRPISMLSFVADWFLSPNDYAQMKRTNLLIHLLSGLIGYVLFARLLCQTKYHKQAKVLSLLISVMWLLSPLNVSTVLYPVQRMAQLSTLFVLLALYSYAFFRTRTAKESMQSQVYAIISALFFIACAAYSKENGVLGVPLILLLEVCFFKGNKNSAGSVKIINGLSIITLISGVSAAVYLFVVRGFDLAAGYASRTFSLQDRLITQIDVVTDYLQNIFVPNIAQMTVFHDDFPISRTFVDSPRIVLYALVFCIIAWVLAKKRSQFGVAIFGVLFFLIAHLLESTVMPLEIYFEHRNYLPMWGGLFFAVVIMYELYVVIDSASVKKMLQCFCGIYCIFLAGSTYVLATQWNTYEQLLLHSYAQHADSFRLNISLAIEFAGKKRYKEAVKYLDAIDEKVIAENKPTVGMRLLFHHFEKTQPPAGLYDQITSPWPIGVHGEAIAGNLNLVAQQILLFGSTTVDVKRLIEVMIKALNNPGQKSATMRWKLNMAVATLERFLEEGGNAIKYYESAWDVFPKNPDPGIKIARLILSREELSRQDLSDFNKTVMRLRKQTLATDALNGEKIQQLEEVGVIMEKQI